MSVFNLKFKAIIRSMVKAQILWSEFSLVLFRVRPPNSFWGTVGRDKLHVCLLNLIRKNKMFWLFHWLAHSLCIYFSSFHYSMIIGTLLHYLNPPLIPGSETTGPKCDARFVPSSVAATAALLRPLPRWQFHLCSLPSTRRTSPAPPLCTDKPWTWVIENQKAGETNQEEIIIPHSFSNNCVAHETF